MSRIALVMMIGGGFLGYHGYEEYKVGASASSEAVHVALGDLEAGIAPPDNHLQIGNHWAIYPAWVGWGEENSDRLDYIYYPIISEQHPYNQAWDKLLMQYGDQEIPESRFPQLKSLAVLVKTKQYRTTGSIPVEWKDVPSITGLLVHEIEDLKSGEEKLLRETFPFLPIGDVMILEEGRTPSSGTKAVAFMGGGVLLLLGGLGVLGKSVQG